MRIVAGTDNDEVDDRLPTDARRGQAGAIPPAGDGRRVQQLAETYERRTIRVVLDDEDARGLAAFASESGEGGELHQFPAGRGPMTIDTPMSPVATHQDQPSDPGLLSRLFMRAARAPMIASALLLLAVLATSGLLIVAAQKLGLL